MMTLHVIYRCSHCGRKVKLIPPREIKKSTEERIANLCGGLMESASRYRIHNCSTHETGIAYFVGVRLEGDYSKEDLDGINT